MIACLAGIPANPLRNRSHPLRSIDVAPIGLVRSAFPMKLHMLRNVVLSGAILATAVGAQASVVISEILAVNTTGLTDVDGAYTDWFELHNSGASAFNLTGYYLTDNAAALTKWQIPAVTLPAGGYLVIFASDKNR